MQMEFLYQTGKDVQKEAEPIHADAWLVGLYYLCLPLTFITLLPGMSALKAVTFPIAGFLALYRLLPQSRKICLNSVHLFYTLQLLFMAGTLLFYRGPESATVVKDVSLALLVTLLATCRVYNQAERRLFSRIWLLVGLICMLLCLFSKKAIDGGRTVIVVLGSEEDPNFFCMYFIFPVLFALEPLTRKTKFRFLTVPYLILVFYAILRTGSRGGLAAILAGVLAFIFLAIRSPKARLSALLLLLLVALVILFIVLPLLPEAVRQRYSPAQIWEDQGSGRFPIWSYLLTQVCSDASSLIHGFGICSTIPHMTAAGFQNTYAHNQWIQTLFDQGLIGLFLYAALMGACFFRNLRRNPLFSCGLVAVWGFSLSLSLYTHKQYLNVFMMCAMSFAPPEETDCQQTGASLPQRSPPLDGEVLRREEED